MGFCQEFGLQVTDGCNHAMVAGRDSCSCPECATVCPGRFSGCPIVWDAASFPVAVHLAPPAALAPPAVLALGVGQIQERPAATSGDTNWTNGARVVTNGTRNGARPGEPGAASSEDLVVTASHDVPRSSMPPGAETESERELRHLCADLKVELRRLSRKVDRLAETEQRSRPNAVLREVDARFAWLTSELSDRLVTLGNEIAGMKQQLAEAAENTE